MPNQLSKSKRRQSLAEHEAVLAALAEIARREDTTVMALLRQATRELVRNRAAEPIQAERLRQLVWKKAPRMPVATNSTGDSGANAEDTPLSLDRMCRGILRWSAAWESLV
jgi:hypothetical protein